MSTILVAEIPKLFHILREALGSGLILFPDASGLQRIHQELLAVEKTRVSPEEDRLWHIRSAIPQRNSYDV